jgi:hypothetical protein
MANKAKYIDMAGLTPIVNGIRVNATKPGQLGTELTATEALYLDGLTAGTVTASKALVVDADKAIATLGAVGMGALTATTIAGTTGTFSGAVTGLRNNVADAAFASPVVLTAAQSGSLCVFDNAAGAIFTLPAAATGLWYDFVIQTSASSNAHRVNCAAADFMVGSVMMHATDDTGLSAGFAADGATHLGINLDAATQGWLAGGKFRLTAISAVLWLIEGDLLGTGTLATPFETT